MRVNKRDVDSVVLSVVLDETCQEEYIDIPAVGFNEVFFHLSEYLNVYRDDNGHVMKLSIHM